ncbi:kinase-like protein [Amniculicola lignicola CBS 123094]|uniref:non-specific serine/threonine protein kinase n=1 Tax=Amniculicola lignicola CBS 123094 TaxID=1392246 RepID=A0A6A5W4A5_9PLEO|nr:kinase-like protein [Amniculicola lignicola CBS 123094]
MSNLVIRIKEKYQLERRLGAGSFGEVYQGRDLQTGQEVALKLEHVNIDRSLLENENDIYEKLSGGPGIPQVYWYGHECEFRVMAFQLLGPNLENLLNYCSRKFSLKTVLLLADQLIPSFRHIHSKGYIHRDVKPENMLMGDGKQGNNVYVTDIGLAKEIEEPGERNCSLIGTTRYASVNAHLGVEQSPRDDMESLGYVLIYFLQGSLPWQGLKADTQEHKEKLILQRKQSATDWGLYKDIPDEFKKYSEHVRSLRSDEPPNYVYLRRLFRNLFRRKGYEYDHVFDWTALKFLEHLETEKRGAMRDTR